MSAALLALLLSWAFAVARCQVNYLQASQNAAILKDTRYLSGDGTFGAAYSQEDGVEFKEESDEYGNRRGSYSYVDPTGQRRTVTYTAGVNGFQASGDHIPSQPPPTPPQPEYVPLAQYNPPDYRPPAGLRAQSPGPRYQLLMRRPYQQPPQYDEGQYEEEPQPRYRAQPPATQPRTRYTRPPTTTPPPPTTPHLAQYHSPYVEYPAGGLRFESKYEAAQYRPGPTAPTALRYRYNEITTQAPRRFYPPGKLDFNRTPDGFSYTFSQNR